MTYRVGNHHGVTIISEGDGARCGRPDHDCERGHLVAVVIDGGDEGDMELAERICALLNGASTVPLKPCDHAHRADPNCVWPDGVCTCGEPQGHACTCTIVGPEPACPVHHGRRARGPKPPPVGPGCTCDGSGRTCPRHGAVI